MTQDPKMLALADNIKSGELEFVFCHPTGKFPALSASQEQRDLIETALRTASERPAATNGKCTFPNCDCGPPCPHYAHTPPATERPAAGELKFNNVEDMLAYLNATPTAPAGDGIREALLNAIDSPTVADLAGVFSPRNNQIAKSYSEQIVDILAPRLAALTDGKAKP